MPVPPRGLSPQGRTECQLGYRKERKYIYDLFIRRPDLYTDCARAKYPDPGLVPEYNTNTADIRYVSNSPEGPVPIIGAGYDNGHA